MTRAVNLASAGSIVSESVGTAPGYMARAWVNFNGTGTVAIRASGNVTSITDNGTGDYTVNFTNAMPDANYTSVITAQDTGGTNQLFSPVNSVTLSTTTNRFRTGYVTALTGAATLYDIGLIQVAVFR